MSSDATILATLTRMGVAPTELGVRATMARPEGSPAELPQLRVGEDIVALGVLGEGGMGVVRLAEQRSLSREVAVKTGRSADPRVVSALVREAVTMGRLEHPSIVPVHALLRADDGAPVLVMKRIEGTTWRTLLLDDAHEAWGPLLAGHHDRFRANVEILMQVSRALSFAHQRGVVHRDLKPDNVMVGRFGEVYLLDWGVALALSEREREPAGIVGTPGYMAPEMARGDPTHLDERTDVYLLGATLFEVLAKRPPHDDPSAVKALVMALEGARVPLPADVPEEAARLVERAMSPDPAARFDSAEAFRVALARLLALREAATLVQGARRARASALAAMDKGGPASIDAFRDLVESRFALVAAQKAAPEDATIREDLDATLAVFVDRELRGGNAESARGYASEMATLPPDLDAAIERVERTRAEERAAAERAKHERAEQDTSRMWRLVVSIVVVGVVVTGLWQLSGRGALTMPTPGAVLAIHAPLVVCALTAVVVYRQRLLGATGPRRLVAFMALWGGISPAFAALDWLRDRAAYDPVPPFVAGLFLTTLEVVVEWRELWPTLPLQAVTIGVCVLSPPHGALALDGFFLLNLIIVVRALRLRARRGSATR